MFFHIIVTNECNSQCRYCYGEALEDTDDDFADFKIDYHLPKKISYDVSLLERFCRRDPDCVLTFYGGEGTYRRVVDNLKLIRQNRFEGELIARMTVMEQTDIYRQATWLVNNGE